MIKIENVDVFGWEAAIRGMRNPLESWKKSDSRWGCVPGHTYPNCGEDCRYECEYIIGENDLTLMKKLCKAGTDHRKYMRMINVTCDITAPLYWWAEYDTYKVGTVRNSCSKMHKLLSRTFEMSDFSFDKLVGYRNEVKQFRPPIDEDMVTYTGKFTAEQREEIKHLWDGGEKSKREIARMYGVSHACINDIISDKYKYAEKTNVFEEVARPIVDTLNELRDSYLNCDDADSKRKIWYSILQLLPESYNQRATVQLNYEVLRNMYHARKNHKLDEWVNFCEWVETLPYAELITGGLYDGEKCGPELLGKSGEN